MKIIKLKEIEKDPEEREEVISAIKKGKIFVYPTDTIYGIGCDATNSEPVKRIREIKRSSQPFSVIAPSISWARENLETGSTSYLEKLPGPYTLIFRMKGSPVCKELSGGTLGVRIPDHPFTQLVSEAGVPFVTTSVNRTGEPPLVDPADLAEGIAKSIDILVDAGRIVNPPSTVIDLSSGKPNVLRK